MVSNSLQQQLLQVLQSLSDEQVTEVIEYAKSKQDTTRHSEYDPANDPLVGFAEGNSTDLSIRAKQILRDEIDPRSGWTQKDKLE